MKNLPETWLTDGLIDFEYKKYQLLDYLNTVTHEFKAQRLYPVLSDLIRHHRNLHEIREKKKIAYENFPERISRADFEKLELVYEKLVEDDAFMQEIDEILEFAMLRMGKALEAGREIFDYIESNLEFVPVGITPLYSNDGYVFLEDFPAKNTRLYRYNLSVFQHPNARFRGLHLHYIDTVKRNLTDTYENLKGRLIKNVPSLPNPATFAIVAKVACPFEQSLLPVAKRILLKYVSTLNPGAPAF